MCAKKTRSLGLKRAASPQEIASLLAIGKRQQEHGNLDAAITAYLKALRLNPANAYTRHELGLVYNLKGDIATAESYYHAACQLAPDMGSAHYNLGNILSSQGKLLAALTCYQKAAELEPDNIDALTNIGVTFYELGQVDRAVAYFQQALAANPGSANLQSSLASALHYIDTATPSDILQASQLWWESHGRPLYRKILYRNPPDPSRRLKVGYISPDFRDHSVYYFITPLLRAHDHRQYEIFCYSDVGAPDWATAEIRSLADHWRDITLASDETVALAIEQDGIDILVDLAGHMTANRLRVFAQKPAPIQISWLGYPGTTGLPTIAYRLVDAITDPAGEADRYHSERLIRLPGCFLCYQPPDEPLEPEPSPQARTGVFTFGSFNNPAKMNQQVIGTWAKILQSLPSARLLLKGKHLHDADVQHSFRQSFASQGAHPSQICFSPHLSSRRQHLALYNDIDLCLDPFPYNGTTTTLEALWMGVPVLTLAGNRHASRVGASLLQAAGHQELVCDTRDRYISTAISMAHRPASIPRGPALRGDLLSSCLCDVARFARQVENAYQGTWQTWAAQHTSMA